MLQWQKKCKQNEFISDVFSVTEGGILYLLHGSRYFCLSILRKFEGMREKMNNENMGYKKVSDKVLKWNM